MKKNNEFFLIVSTLGRKEELKNLLDSLVRQTYKNFEVHIIDQNNGPLIDELVIDASKYIKIIQHKVDFKGVSKGRTYGLKFVKDKHTVIAFPDDDCIYANNCLEKVNKHFSSKDIAILSGVNVDYEDYEELNSFNNQVVKLNIFNVWKKGPTYVFFYSKEAVNGVGGYDEELGPSPKSLYLSGEDSDYSIRIIKKYGDGIKDNTLKIAHPKLNINGDSDYYKCVGYSLGRMKVLKKHKYPKWFIFLNKIYPLKGFILNLKDKKMRKFYLLQMVSRW